MTPLSVHPAHTGGLKIPVLSILSYLRFPSSGETVFLCLGQEPDSRVYKKIENLLVCGVSASFHVSLRSLCMRFIGR